MTNVKRPACNETDEDLLKEQTLFLNEGKKPAAHVIAPKAEQGAKTNQETKSIVEDKKDILIENFMSDVVERKVSFPRPFVFESPPEDVQNLGKKNLKISRFSAQRKSLFVQLLNSSKDVDLKEEEKQDETSVIIDGLDPALDSLELMKIHEENLTKLSAMSPTEILECQEQLKKQLKPEVVNFIRSRKKVSSAQNKPQMQKVPNEKVRGQDSNTDFGGLIVGEHTSEECGENKKLEMPSEVIELLDGDSRGLWRNVEVERSKLQWMTDLPKPLDIKTGYTARFDFEGKLMSRKADVPTHQGLHHHGQEPEVAGYSLEELFLLARSSLQSQRITALNTIAHILDNNWCGMMDLCFESPLLPVMLNAGIVPLLRWSLDDVSLTSVSATISAIHSLLISKADEACLIKMFCWLNGHIVPQLEPVGVEDPSVVDEELTDADLIKMDVVKGLLRIDILPRFMYILRVMCPPPLVCKLVLEISSRLAQHSYESATQVANHPGFLELVFQKFLPLNWKFVDSSLLSDTVDYSCPMYPALKLVRILASSSKELAINLINKFSLMTNITFYLTVDGKLPAPDAQLLVVEAFKTWHTFLCYGTGLGVFLDIFPILLKQLDFCLSLNLTETNSKDLDYAAVLFKVFEAVAVAAHQHADSASTAISVVFKKSLVGLKKWIWQFSKEKTSMLFQAQKTLLATCINFIVTYCRESHKGLTCENWEPCSDAKEAFEKYLVPAISTSVFQECLEFKPFSLILNSKMDGNKRDDRTLVSLGSILYGEDVVPILKEESPLPLLSAFMNYAIWYGTFFQNIQCLQPLFSAPVLEYLRALNKDLKRSCWFLQFETYYLYQLIHLSTYISFGPVNDFAMSALCKFSSSQEYLVEQMIENVTCAPKHIQRLTNDTVKRLPVIAQCYISCFLKKEAVEHSRNILLRKTDVKNLFCLSTPILLIPKDWSFIPICNLYQQSKRSCPVTPVEVLQVKSCLSWIQMCHALNSSILKEIPAPVQFYYLSMVFLLDEDLFRDEHVKCLLLGLLKVILKNKSLNLSHIKWNNINTFEDAYCELLVQYEAVSYGDEVFSIFLVLALQQQCPCHWKRILLTEHANVLRFLALPLKQIPVPLENFLNPVETDLPLLVEYFRALASGILDQNRCPLLHLMAVHHIHHFLKSNDYSKGQKLLLSTIFKSNKDIQDKILLYDQNNGFSVKKELSQDEKDHLNNIVGSNVFV